jgi:hypothetical protein
MADFPRLQRCQLCRETAANYVLESDTAAAPQIECWAKLAVIWRGGVLT